MKNRFEIVSEENITLEQGGSVDLIVLRDRQTGVMYSLSLSKYGFRMGGMTPLVDKDGKPLMTF